MNKSLRALRAREVARPVEAREPVQHLQDRDDSSTLRSTAAGLDEIARARVCVGESGSSLALSEEGGTLLITELGWEDLATSTPRKDGGGDPGRGGCSGSRGEMRAQPPGVRAQDGVPPRDPRPTPRVPRLYLPPRGPHHD